MTRSKPMGLLSAALMFAVSAVTASAAAAPRLGDLRWHRRILVIAAPTSGVAAVDEQHRVLDGWRQGAADRDMSLIEIIGQQVSGVSDPADALRRHFALPADRFEVLLIGKDGHVALRSSHPIEAKTLQRAIDAMPMRRAGER